MKLYFSNFEELAYNKKYILSEMIEYGLKEIKVFEAIRNDNKDIFFCKANQAVGEKGNGFYECGKMCIDYSPRNNKSGCCKYRGSCYEYGDKYILNINGRLKKI